LAQPAVDDKTNEMQVGLDLLRSLVLEGRLVTMDAWLDPAPDCAAHGGRQGRLGHGGQRDPAPVIGRHEDRVGAAAYAGGAAHGGSNAGPGAWPPRAALAAHQ